MRHPVFFSFAGDAKALVERIRSKFRDELVYVYTRTGVDGDSFPAEILSELRQCELFVVFWSAAYVAGDPSRPWCRRELLTALRRYEQGGLRRFLIVQVDGTPLDQTVIDPDTGLSIDGLRAFREDGRAFTHPIKERAIEQRLSAELAKIDQSDHPLLPRTELQELLRRALKTGDLQTKTPITFVSGFHGSGRRTLVRLITQSEYRHLTEYPISLDSVDGPEDLLRLIWGDVLHKSKAEQRLMMRDVQQNPSALRRYYAQLGMLLVANRCYVIVSKDDATDVSEVLPFWASEYLGLVSPTVQPLIFCTIGRPLPEFMMRAIPSAGHVPVPTLEEAESVELANRVIAAVDPVRVGRWQQHIPEIVAGGANNAKLIVDIVRIASRRASLDFLLRDIVPEVERFDQRVQAVVQWAWEAIAEDGAAIQLLDVVNLLGVAHIDALTDIFRNSAGSVGDSLYRLMEVGLVEHLSESTYRIPRALARKLNLHFAGALPRNQSMDLIRGYARAVDVGREDDSSAVVLNNRLQSKLATDAEIDADDLVFVTAALLFKAGWQRYRLGQTSAALPLLRRAFGATDRVRDDSTRLEIVRYFGLAAAREQSVEDVAAAVRYLRHVGNFHFRYEAKVKAMALFVQGFAYKCESQYALALPKYEEALDLLPPEGRTEHQRSQMLNEAVQCMLRIEPTDYERALDFARRACALRENPNNIDVLLRALLARTYFDRSTPRDEVSRNIEDMDHWESILKTKSAIGALSFYSRRRIDRLEAEAVDAVMATGQEFPSLDLQAVVSMCQEALQTYQDDALLWRKWDLMLLTELGRDWRRLHTEATEYLSRGAPNKMARGNAARIKILTFDIEDEVERRAAYMELERFRADGTLPRSIAGDIKRHLDLGEAGTGRVLGKLLKHGLRGDSED